MFLNIIEVMWQVCISFLSISNQCSLIENWYTWLLAKFLEALSEWCFKLISTSFPSFHNACLSFIKLACLSFIKTKVELRLEITFSPFLMMTNHFPLCVDQNLSRMCFLPLRRFLPLWRKRFESLLCKDNENKQP